MAEEYGILVVEAERGGLCTEIRALLLAMEGAYNNLYSFDIYIDRARDLGGEGSSPTNYYNSRPRPNFRSLKPLKNIENLVLPEDRLQLVSVVIQSPGFWEFLGALNPLEVMRNYINDRHERRKDFEYRETMEHQKMVLENESLQTKVIQERVDLLRSLGVPEEQIRQALSEHVFKPLSQLDMFQDNKLINGASIRRVDGHNNR